MPQVPRYVGWPLLAAWTYGVIYFLANRAPYHPVKNPEGEPPPAGVTEVFLRASDGVRLCAWWIPQREARLATLFLHGNSGNVTYSEHRLLDIPGAGSSLLMLDYRGYGKSEGRPTERGLYADADAAYQYLIEAGHAPERIVLYGESLGSAVAVDLASRRSCAGVVLEAPLSSGRDMAARILPVLGPLVFWSFDSKSKIAKVRAPLLILHGDRDEVIPFELGRSLFEVANEPKTFWAVKGAGHNNLVEVAGAQYRERLREFYRTLQ